MTNIDRLRAEYAKTGDAELKRRIDAIERPASAGEAPEADGDIRDEPAQARATKGRKGAR